MAKLLTIIIWSLLAAGIILLWAGCADMPQARPNKTGKARVTLYHPYERDRVLVKKGRHKRYRWVCWGRKTSSGCKATEGVTVAAPSWVPFGTRVSIPALKGVVGNGSFVVQDRGDGVRRLHTNEWFDVFVSNKRKMNYLASVLPEWLDYTLQ